LTYPLFVVLALLLPGWAAQRLLNVRPDHALVLPVGLVLAAVCQACAWRAGVVWAFPVLLALPVVAACVRAPRAPGGQPGPTLVGALPALVVLIAFLALTVYPLNRRVADGAFLFDRIERIDTAFQAGVAWELAGTWPPEVPGLAGVRLSYHFGQHLVRAAAVIWAGVTPYDLLNRWDVTLVGLALVLALRAAVAALGGNGWAVTVAGFVPVLADAAFVLGGLRGADWWTDLLSSNLQMPLAFGNTLVPALVLLLGLLVAWRRYLRGEGRGFLLLAALLAGALPCFKVFLAAPLACGLLLALLLGERRRATLALLLPLVAMMAWLLSGGGGATVEVWWQPLAPMRRTAESLMLNWPGWPAWAAWTLLWLLLAAGWRACAAGELWGALRAREPLRLTLAATILAGLVPGLLLRITYVGEGVAYNEGVYFVQQSAILSALFAACVLGRWAGHGRALLVGLLTLALGLPTTVQFVVRKRASAPGRLPASLMRVLDVLARESQRGDVVIAPITTRWPPPALTLLGRRQPYTRFIPYMAQFASAPVLERRRALMNAFFKSREPGTALALARALGGRHVLVYGHQSLAFVPEPAFELRASDGNVHLYRVPPAEAPPTP
jgi:hypothetical protein